MPISMGSLRISLLSGLLGYTAVAVDIAIVELKGEHRDVLMFY